MGTVHLAVRDDDAFQRRVAIKVLRRGMDTDAIVQRFRHERQILASLDHPYIAHLLDGGSTPDGLPFFAMEYIEGQPITEFCESRQLDTTARLKLFRNVCSAVQYAHQNLIIHRDIKPANVLVTADGAPKLLDFGIAKLLNPELGGQVPPQTAAGLHLMTPEYASPEQVRGEPVTTATDVYSLGVLLYELLTGRRPYHLTSRAPAEIARVVCEAVPARPSTAVTAMPDAGMSDDVATGEQGDTAPTRITAPTRLRSVEVERLRRRLAGDLDNIVLKALSKEPQRRYGSADLFSEDVRRHLEGLPVFARKDTLRYRAVKVVGRNRVAVAAAATTIVALLAGIIGTTWQARVARAERQQAEQRFDDVRRLANALLFDVHDQIQDLPGSTPARKLLVTKALEYLDKLARDAGDRTDLRSELAAAYLKVGDVQGRPLVPNLGDVSGARESYTKSIALFESIGAASPRPQDPAAHKDSSRLGTAYMRLGDVVAAMGDTAGALAHARKGLALQEQVAGGADASVEARRELAASHSRVSDLLAATGKVPAALEHRRTSLALMQGLVAIAPDDAANLRQLGSAYQKLANTLGNPNAPNLGDLQGALAALERSGAAFRRGIELYPNNALFRRNLAVVHSNTADVLSGMGRRAEALARQREALAIFEGMAAADPANVAAKNDVAISLSKVAEMLSSGGRPGEAVRQYERALEIHQALAAGDPDNAAFTAEVASDYNRLATAEVALGDRTRALAHHSRAVEISRELSAANAADVELGLALAMALGGRADAHAAFAARPPATRAAHLEAAERDYGEAVALLSRLRDQGALVGTDVEILTRTQASLDRVRQRR